eukprot:CAMPEP_0198248630 /NCGR_PEP_ID=MMETSP1447-20131203/373_1 /TAXON_ID=420782 /ORGANISM="Chaetoceros dichaeta, Strain CCMP1751" /LENGTH=251 /DNA_ID=CAMNT_0043933089 /DNA_START=13 /DNA_END=765 /DNA_ORIENTATION=+
MTMDMELTSPSPSSTAPSLPGHIASITFALHPKRSLRVSLHTSISTNPHIIFSRTSALPSNDASGDRYAIIDAKRVVSLTHLGIAANSALLRLHHFEQSTVDATNTNTNTNMPTDTTVGRKRRGAALETILCAGGSTNVGSVLKEFAFDANSVAAAAAAAASVQQQSEQSQEYDVLFLGYDCESEEEFTTVLSDVGLDAPRDESAWNAYFARERDGREMQEMAKIFKLSPEELARDGFSLEKAVLNRVATK